MNYKTIYGCILDFLSYKRLHYLNWSYTDSFIYSYTYLGDNKELSLDLTEDLSIYDFIVDSLISIRHPFVLNMSKYDYINLEIFDVLLSLGSSVLDRLIFIEDPLDEGRIFIVFFNKFFDIDISDTCYSYMNCNDIFIFDELCIDYFDKDYVNDLFCDYLVFDEDWIDYYYFNDDLLTPVY